MGKIDNCIVVAPGKITYTDKDADGNEIKNTSYQLLSCPSKGYSATTAANTHNALDENRKNCIIFESGANLLSFFNGGYAIDGDVGYVTDETQARITETTVFSAFSAETWSFTQTSVTFFGTALYTV